jgi:hypothetical protein
MHVAAPIALIVPALVSAISHIGPICVRNLNPRIPVYPFRLQYMLTLYVEFK